MDHFVDIYSHRAALYDRMVSCEDYEGNILPALDEICRLWGLDIVEFGAGTGRLTRLLTPIARFIYAFDLSHHMLETGQPTLMSVGDNWVLAVADSRKMPVANHVADLTIAGWTFGHAMTWYRDQWEEAIGRMIGEMMRILRPGGTAIIIETMGTGNESPAPPKDYLAAYYRWLENERGFSYSWIRTDYRFESVQEADALIRFFFGDELADRIMREHLTILPECTGIWWKHVWNTSQSRDHNASHSH